MSPASVLAELRELNFAWRKQSFNFTTEQQARYDSLVVLRRARVRELYETDRVYKAGAK